MFDTVSKMPVSEDETPNKKLQTNIQNNDINLSNNIHLDYNNNLFARNNLEIKMQDKNNNNFNNNSQNLSNKRRIDEGSINNDCNNQLNKKFKQEGLDTEEQINGVYILLALINVELYSHLAIFFTLKLYSLK